jgi:hypothetical protein
MLLELDDLDFDAIQRAVAIRQTVRALPEYDINLVGVLIAEICRGWMEYRESHDSDSD